MNPVRSLLLLAAFNGFLAVLLGAFGAHALEALLPPPRLLTWGTAVDYHMFHVAALLGTALAAAQYGEVALLRWSGLLFAVGILLFSGSLYLLAWSGASWLGMLTPFGGLAFLAGWSLLGLAVWRRAP